MKHASSKLAPHVQEYRLGEARRPPASPEGCRLYAVYDEAGALYVGRSINPANRIQEHLKQFSRLGLEALAAGERSALWLVRLYDPRKLRRLVDALAPTELRRFDLNRKDATTLSEIVEPTLIRYLRPRLNVHYNF